MSVLTGAELGVLVHRQVGLCRSREEAGLVFTSPPTYLCFTDHCLNSSLGVS